MGKWRKSVERRVGWMWHLGGRFRRGAAERLPTRAVAGHAYAALAAVFLLVGLFTVERAAKNNRRTVLPPRSAPVAFQELRRPVLVETLDRKGKPAAAAPAKREAPTPETPASAEKESATPPALEREALNGDAWKYFHAAWSEDGGLVPLGRSANLFFGPIDLPADVRTLVEDPRKRLEAEFRVPPYLRTRVLFWMQVHASYGNRMRVVHDRDDLSVVYGYLDFRALYRTAGSAAEGDALAHRLESKILKELKARLSEAAGLVPAGTTKQTVTERTRARDFLSGVGALSATDAADAIAHIRTQTGQRDEFLAALRRSKELLPHIESVFRRNALPVALARIPFVESSFNARARSSVGAVGIWQFMPATARQMMGSNQSSWADPLKQTIAATKVLRLFRGLLPDWSTAVTAYNSGVGRMQKLVRRYRAKTLEPLLSEDHDDADGLGFAGENFYAEFLSANLIEAYKDELFPRSTEAQDLFVVFKDGVPFAKPSDL